VFSQRRTISRFANAWILVFSMSKRSSVLLFCANGSKLNIPSFNIASFKDCWLLIPNTFRAAIEDSLSKQWVNKSGVENKTNFTSQLDQDPQVQLPKQM
jgi:hypothetical protein